METEMKTEKCKETEIKLKPKNLKNNLTESETEK